MKLAEGIVIRPEVEFTLPNGSRALFKLKAKRFAEVAHDVGKVADGLVDNWGAVARAYATENRLSNVLSKDTLPTTMEAFMARLPAYVKDAMDDLRADHPAFVTLPNKKQRQVEAEVIQACRGVLLRVASDYVSFARQ